MARALHVSFADESARSVVGKPTESSPELTGAVPGQRRRRPPPHRSFLGQSDVVMFYYMIL